MRTDGRIITNVKRLLELARQVRQFEQGLHDGSRIAGIDFLVAFTKPRAGEQGGAVGHVQDQRAG